MTHMIGWKYFCLLLDWSRVPSKRLMPAVCWQRRTSTPARTKMPKGDTSEVKRWEGDLDRICDQLISNQSFIWCQHNYLDALNSSRSVWHCSGTEVGQLSMTFWRTSCHVAVRHISKKSTCSNLSKGSCSVIFWMWTQKCRGLANSIAIFLSWYIEQGGVRTPNQHSQCPKLYYSRKLLLQTFLRHPWHGHCIWCQHCAMRSWIFVN